MEYPQYAVSYWIGNSIEISGKHYANSVPDALYDKVALTETPKAVQNPVQSGGYLLRARFRASTGQASLAS